MKLPTTTRSTRTTSKLTFHHREAIAKLEGINKMTKYQLVFIKMQTVLSKLCVLMRNKELIKLQKGFDKLRGSAVRTEKAKAKNALTRLKNTLEAVTKIKERSTKGQLAQFVCRWRTAVARHRILEGVRRKHALLEEKQKKELISKNRTISALKQELQQHNSEVTALKEQQGTLKWRLKEGRLQTKPKSPDAKSSEDSVQLLEARLERLEAQNRDLRDRLESAEVNVEDFIQGVSEILDSHEFARSFGVSVGLRLEEVDVNENQEGSFKGKRKAGKAGAKKTLKYKSKALFSSN
eukprot:TRINITY_DN9354_c0_g12_i1.p1 TRINITY_DN9354_c0_g12~~TRINITY_DN9354_c0_g12_i1.p1  ORF type:complete len:294 (+),score=82.49 TRINITY_DN9354_c0_g12_i1:205-1086(+)